MKKNITLTINEDSSNIRLDKALHILLSDKSRTFLLKLIEDGDVLVNGKQEKPSYKTSLNDCVNVFIPEVSELSVEKENIPLDIVYEDDDVIVINKPQGMVVHPSLGHENGTLVNAILYHTNNLSGINGVKRPGIVHRIDKDTSGLIVVTKNNYAHNFIAAQLKDHSMYRNYYALVKGEISENKASINAPIGRDVKNRQKMAVNTLHGKDAVTTFKVVERFKGYSLLSLKLQTGRTHQIRVHLAYINHPVVGDEVYGKKSPLYDKGQLLHAYEIHFIHPTSKKEVSFQAPLPSYFTKVLDSLR